jgi:hypothetical protein
MKTPSNPARNSLNFMGEFPSKEHWQNCFGTLLDNFLEIDAIIRDIIFMDLLITFYIQCERKLLFGATLEEKNKSLVAPAGS